MSEPIEVWCAEWFSGEQLADHEKPGTVCWLTGHPNLVSCEKCRELMRQEYVSSLPVVG